MSDASLQKYIASLRSGTENPALVQQFTVDEENAIIMMRRFALENPRFYILELAQAAVANQTDFIEIVTSDTSDGDIVTIHWTGVGFDRLELLHLFDFLFTAQKSAEHVDISLLARGVNALLHFQPTEIAIFVSGDKLADNFQVLVDPLTGTVKSVEPYHRFRFYTGVCIEARGLRGIRELVTVKTEEPIHSWLGETIVFPFNPYATVERQIRYEEWLLRRRLWFLGQVIFNGKVITSDPGEEEAQRRKQKRGREVFIEEPDLHGPLWTADSDEPGWIDLVTWGVVIERIEAEELPFDGVRGRITFNDLSKTADHGRIVRDASLDHLWARLKPYIDSLRTGGSVQSFYKIRDFSNRRLNPKGLRDILSAHERLLVLSPKQAQQETNIDQAREVLREIGAAGLIVPREEISTLQALVQGKAELLILGQDPALDLEFFSKPVCGRPVRPWFIEPIEPPALPGETFFTGLCERFPEFSPLISVLPASFRDEGELRLRIYSFREAFDAHATDMPDRERGIELRLLDRPLWRGPIPSAHACHEVIIDLPSLAPSLLSMDLYAPIAQYALERARPWLEQATVATLRTLLVSTPRGTSPSCSLVGRVVLHHIARTTITRRRARPGGDHEIVLEPMLHGDSAWLFDTPVLSTLAGEPITISDIGEQLRQRGMVWGALQEGKGIGALDPTRGFILAIDEEQERCLIDLVGTEHYRRADGQNIPFPPAPPGHAELAAPMDYLPDDPDEDSSWLMRRSMVGPLWVGEVGIPTRHLNAPSISAIEAYTKRRISRDLFVPPPGLIGRIELLDTASPATLDQLADALEKLSRQCHLDLLEALSPSLDETQRHRIQDLLLDYASKHSQLVECSENEMVLEIRDPLARRILTLPFFLNARGHLTSPRALLLNLRLHRTREASHIVTAEDFPEQLMPWIEARRRILRPSALPGPSLQNALSDIFPSSEGVPLVQVILTPSAPPPEAFELPPIGPSGSPGHIIIGQSTDLYLDPAHETISTYDPSTPQGATLLLTITSLLRTADPRLAGSDEIALQARVLTALALPHKQG